MDSTIKDVVDKVESNIDDPEVVADVKEAMDNLESHLKNDADPYQAAETPRSPNSLRPDAYMTMAQIVQGQGFGFEQFQVTTQDGYQLTVMHILGKGWTQNGAPVFMQHGLDCSAEVFVTNADMSPAFMLARAGFDVWLGNNRGNLYSRRNNHIDPGTDPKDFYEYSFYELGKYDAPAQIDFVRAKTGRAKIAYIGHSQGTSQMFAALAENAGNLNTKLTSFTAFAPVANLANSQTPFARKLYTYWKPAWKTARTLGMYELRNKRAKPSKLQESFCNTYDQLCESWEKFTNPEYGSPYNNP